MFTATIMMLRSIALAFLIRAVTTEHAKLGSLFITKDSNFFRIIACHFVNLEGSDSQVSSLEKLLTSIFFAFSFGHNFKARNAATGQ